MEKEKFIKILEKHEIPTDVHEKWWDNLRKNHFIFCCGDSNALLDFFVSNAKEKGCVTSAPW